MRRNGQDLNLYTPCGMGSLANFCASRITPPFHQEEKERLELPRPNLRASLFSRQLSTPLRFSISPHEWIRTTKPNILSIRGKPIPFTWGRSYRSKIVDLNHWLTLPTRVCYRTTTILDRSVYRDSHSEKVVRGDLVCLLAYRRIITYLLLYHIFIDLSRTNISYDPLTTVRDCYDRP